MKEITRKNDGLSGNIIKDFEYINLNEEATEFSEWIRLRRKLIFELDDGINTTEFVISNIDLINGTKIKENDYDQEYLNQMRKIIKSYNKRVSELRLINTRKTGKETIKIKEI